VIVPIASKTMVTKATILTPIMLASMAAILTIFVQATHAQSEDWTLTINAIKVPLGDSNIHVNIKGPFGYTSYSNIPTQHPSTIIKMQGNEFPIGYRYQLCMSSSLEGIIRAHVLPNCLYFTHEENDETVNMSPR
jgi:hypothetical protein